MAAANSYNPYDSEDWDSDDDWEGKDCRDLTIDDAREIAEHLKQNRRVAKYMSVLQRSRVRKELLFTTELGTAVARHCDHEGCGELVRETLKRLVFISKGLPDDVNDKFDERHGARIKMSKEGKKLSISPVSGTMTDSSDGSPASVAEKKPLLKAVYRNSTATSSKTNHSTKALTTFKQVQKEVQKREKEAEKAAKAEAKLANQKRKADASSEGSSAKVVKAEPKAKKKKVEVVPSFESLEVLHADRLTRLKAQITSVEESKAKVQGIDNAVMNNLIVIKEMAEKKAAAKKKQQVVANSVPDSQHLTTETIAAKVQVNDAVRNNLIAVKETVEKKAAAEKKAQMVDNSMPDSQHLRAPPIEAKVPTGTPRVLSHYELNKEKEEEETKEFIKKMEAEKKVWAEEWKKAQMEEELMWKMQEIEFKYMEDYDYKAARRQYEEEVKAYQERDELEKRREMENRLPLKPVHNQVPPSSLVKLTIFSPQKPTAQLTPVSRQQERMSFVPVLPPLPVTLPPPTVFHPKLTPAEVVAQHLQALPAIPQPHHFSHFLKNLTADVLTKAEILIGRQMNRVERIWWELLFRDFGRKTLKFSAPIRQVYRDHVEAAKRKQLEDDKKRAQFNNSSMFLPPPPPRRF